MALVQSDIKVFKSTNISDTSANGGAMSTLELVDVVGALFPNVDNTERLNGSEKWRKVFFKLHNDGLLPLISARLYQDMDTNGTDTILMAPATSIDDTQVSLPGTPHLYGSLPLAFTVSSGATSISVALPQGVTTSFYQVGDTIRVTDKDITSGVGNEDFVAITSVDTIGSSVTLAIAPPLSVGYSSSTARVMNVLEYGDLYAKVTNQAITSTAGLFDFSKIVLNNRSAISSTWTLTFTSSTAFTMTSSVAGAMGAGNTSNQVVLNNPSYNLPYLAIPTAAFGGNYLSGDTITFTTLPAALPVWLKRIVPAGATPVAVNRAVYVLDGGTV